MSPAFATDQVVSAANPNIGVTPDSLASVFADNISTVVQSASVPWPTSLGDVAVVYVRDSTPKDTMCGILFVSTGQMNIWIPPAATPGPAMIMFPVTGLPPGFGTAALRSIPVTIQRVAPALFSADGTGSGVAAATAVRIVIPTAIQAPVPVFTCDPVKGCSAVPIDPGIDAPVFLSFYGTGIRGLSSPDNVYVTIGGQRVKPSYVGPQIETPGLDQVNVPLVLSLRGAGLVDVTVTVDGVTSNAVKINVQ
jgi:uncharacterized protein (TIGR03437 family)